MLANALLFWVILSSILHSVSADSDFGYHPRGTSTRVMNNDPQYYENFPSFMHPGATTKTYTATQVLITASQTELTKEALLLYNNMECGKGRSIHDRYYNLLAYTVSLILPFPLLMVVNVCYV